MKTYTIDWDEWLDCSTTVDAESAQEAEKKFHDGQHGEVIERIEMCDGLKIHESKEQKGDDDCENSGSHETQAEASNGPDYDNKVNMKKYILRWNETTPQVAVLKARSRKEAEEQFLRNHAEGNGYVMDSLKIVQDSDICVIHTDDLNILYKQFLQYDNGSGDFKNFVEQNQKCIDLRNIAEFMEGTINEYLCELVQCDEYLLLLNSDVYIKVINSFEKLLGNNEEITLADIRTKRAIGRFKSVQDQHESVSSCYKGYKEMKK